MSWVTSLRSHFTTLSTNNTTKTDGHIVFFTQEKEVSSCITSAELRRLTLPKIWQRQHFKMVVTFLLTNAEWFSKGVWGFCPRCNLHWLLLLAWQASTAALGQTDTMRRNEWFQNLQLLLYTVLHVSPQLTTLVASGGILVISWLDQLKQTGSQTSAANIGRWTQTCHLHRGEPHGNQTVSNPLCWLLWLFLVFQGASVSILPLKQPSCPALTTIHRSDWITKRLCARC